MLLEQYIRGIDDCMMHHTESVSPGVFSRTHSSNSGLVEFIVFCQQLYLVPQPLAFQRQNVEFDPTAYMLSLSYNLFLTELSAPIFSLKAVFVLVDEFFCRCLLCVLFV